jgi:hypothetical protein
MSQIWLNGNVGRKTVLLRADSVQRQRCRM